MPIGWGLVGCGDVATRKVLPSFQHARGAKVLAVTSRHRERAEACAGRFGIPRVYDRLEDLLRDREIDAVYIATPPYLHHPQTLAAAAAGKHVLCEKPMAVSVAACREMIDACRRHGVSLMVAYYRRF